MELKTLRACFGRLDGAELRLHSGLNIIEAPNESGKSTWAAFFRAMLYGISTAERSRGGSLPDKKRYQPWSGAPMAGVAELSWQGKDITLRRTSPGGGKPMGMAQAVYTGTEEAVPELRSGVPGETILGVTEPVFRRSAFISGSDMALDANSELEKRITRLVTSGEERSSYTEAEERLRRWQRKRRWRSGGALGEAEQRRRELQEKLRGMESENLRLSELRAEGEKLRAQTEALKHELALHLRDERKAERQRRREAEEAYAASEREAEAALRALSELEEETKGLSAEKVRDLRAAAVRLGEAAQDRDEAKAALDKVKEELAALPPAELPKNKKKTAVTLLFIVGVLFLLGGLAGGMALLPLPVWGTYALLVAGLVLLLIASALLSAGKKEAKAAQAEKAHALELGQQAADAAQAHYDACQAETEACGEAQRAALLALGEAEDTDPEAAAARAEEKLLALRDERIREENARRMRERLALSPAEPMAPIPEDELEGEPKIKKAAAEDYLRRTEEKLREVDRELNRGEGMFELLGDPLLLATEEANLTRDIHRLQGETDALELALDALREANAQLQTLFSPLISRRAAALLSRMTDSAYAGVYFDREMHFSAQRSGDLDAHALEYLSEGTRNQLYLAVRLAICELVLSGEEPCPLILDDVLAVFDDRRAKDTLRLLRELSRDRQIILFTCQGREQRLLSELEKEDE